MIRACARASKNCLGKIYGSVNSIAFRSSRQFSITYRKPQQQNAPEAVDASTDVATASAAGGEGTVHDPRFFEKYSFTADFLSARRITDVQAVPGATYMKVDVQQFEELLPEGVSGPMQKTLRLGDPHADVNSKRSAMGGTEVGESPVWMVRESTKLVCRLIDEHEARITGQRRDGKVGAPATDAARDLHLPGLTDREEWPANTLKVTHYGRDLVNFSKEPLQGQKNYVRLVKQHDCAVESVVGQLTGADKQLPDKILLTGERGVGKSFVMTQAVLYARQRGWLVVHVPRGWDQVCDGSYIEPPVVPLPEQRVTSAERDILTSMEAVANPSVRNPHHPSFAEAAGLEPPVFDNVFQSAGALRGFYLAHAEQLREIPIAYSSGNDNSAHYWALFDRLHGPDGGEERDKTRTYSSVDALLLLRKQFLASAEKILSTPGRAGLGFMPLRELVEGEDSFPDVDVLDAEVLRGFDMAAFEFKTLADLALFGIAMRGAAGSCFAHLMEELRRSQVQKVLLAVDQYNTFDAPSAYKWNTQTVMGRDLCVPRALYGLSKKRAHNDAFTIAGGNGIMLCATSHTHEEGRRDTFTDALKSVPLVVRVPGYNQAEFLAAMRHQAHSQRLTEFVTVAQLLTYRMLCASNPEQVQANSFLYFTALGLNQHLDSERFEYLSSSTETAAALRAAQLHAVESSSKGTGQAGTDNGDNEEGDEDGEVVEAGEDQSPHTTAASNNVLLYGVTEQQRRAKLGELDARFADFKRNFKGV